MVAQLFLFINCNYYGYWYGTVQTRRNIVISPISVWVELRRFRCVFTQILVIPCDFKWLPGVGFWPGPGDGVGNGFGVGIPLGNGVGLRKSQYGFWQHGLAGSWIRTHLLSRFGNLLHLWRKLRKHTVSYLQCLFHSLKKNKGLNWFIIFFKLY